MSEGVPPSPMMVPKVDTGACCCARSGAATVNAIRSTSHVAEAFLLVLPLFPVRETRFTDPYSWRKWPILILHLKHLLAAKVSVAATSGAGWCYTKISTCVDRYRQTSLPPDIARHGYRQTRRALRTGAGISLPGLRESHRMRFNSSGSARSKSEKSS